MASDIDVWKFAKANDYIIVTNDEDFINLLSMHGFPSKVVLLKTGNQRNKYLADLLIEKKNKISTMYQNLSYGLIEVY